jgi:hypothetical protein
VSRKVASWTDVRSGVVLIQAWDFGEAYRSGHFSRTKRRCIPRRFDAKVGSHPAFPQDTYSSMQKVVSDAHVCGASSKKHRPKRKLILS